MGLEVGSKTELLVALSLPVPEDAFISCNGFKDAEYIQLALHGRAIGKPVVVVIERRAELAELIAQCEELGITNPLIGLRMKLTPMPSPLRVNRLFMALVRAAGVATWFSRYAAESVKDAPKPSTSW